MRRFTKMILTYKECIEKYKNHYSLMEALKCGEIYKISKGIYSTEKYVKDLSIFRNISSIFIRS